MFRDSKTLEFFGCNTDVAVCFVVFCFYGCFVNYSTLLVITFVGAEVCVSAVAFSLFGVGSGLVVVRGASKYRFIVSVYKWAAVGYWYRTSVE